MPRNSPNKVPEFEESTRKSPRLIKKSKTVEIEINLEVGHVVDVDDHNDNNNNNESEGEGQEFEVEKVLKKRVRNGKTEYYVKWVGYDHSHNEWVDNLNDKEIDDVDDVMEEEEEEGEEGLTLRSTRTPTTTTNNKKSSVQQTTTTTTTEESNNHHNNKKENETPNKRSSLKRVSFSTSSENEEDDDFIVDKKKSKRTTPPEKNKKDKGKTEGEKATEQTPPKAKANKNNNNNNNNNSVTKKLLESESKKTSKQKQEKGESKEVEIVIEIDNEDDDFEPKKSTIKKEKEKDKKGKEKEKIEEKTTPKKIEKVEEKSTPKGKVKIDTREKKITPKQKGKGKRELEEDPSFDPHYNPLLDNEDNNNNNNNNNNHNVDERDFLNDDLQNAQPQYLDVDQMPPRGRFHRRSWGDLARFARVKPVVATSSKPILSISFEDSYSTPLSSSTLASFLPKPTTTPGKKKRDRSVIEGLRDSKKKFSTLQELCISYLVKEIENVESFGLLPSEVQNNICKLMAKKGKLVPKYLHLFLENGVEILDLTNCSELDDASLKMIAERCTELRTFRLSECGRFSDTVLNEVAFCCPLIVDFSLNGAYRLTDQSVCNFIETHKNLKRFSLFWSYRLTKQFSECLVQHCENSLQSLTLGMMTQMNDKILAPLKGLSSLTHLHLEGLTEVTDKSLVLLLESKSQKTLQEIKLIGLTQVGGFEFSKAIINCVSLTNFTLEGSELFVDDFLLDIIKHKGSELKVLSLSNNKLLTDVSIPQIWVHCPRLVTLCLADLPFLSIESIKPILLFNPSKPSFIENLDISWCRVIDNEVLELFLKHLTKLKKMTLWGCSKITDFQMSLVVKQFGIDIIGRDVFVYEEVSSTTPTSSKKKK